MASLLYLYTRDNPAGIAQVQMGHFSPHLMGHLVPPAVWAEGQGINRFSSQDGGCWTRTEPCLWEMEMGHEKPGYKQTPQPKCEGGNLSHQESSAWQAHPAGIHTPNPAVVLSKGQFWTRQRWPGKRALCKWLHGKPPPFSLFKSEKS